MLAQMDFYLADIHVLVWVAVSGGIALVLGIMGGVVLPWYRFRLFTAEQKALKSVRVSHLVVYPIKSCAGVHLKRVSLTETGFKHDRRFMIAERVLVPIGPTDDATLEWRYQFVSQRSDPRLALVQTKFIQGGTKLEASAPGRPGLWIDLKPTAKARSLREKRIAQVWFKDVVVEDLGDGPAEWFSVFLERPVRVVEHLCAGENARQFPLKFNAKVESQGLALGGVQNSVSLADGFPILLVNFRSVVALSKRIAETASRRAQLMAEIQRKRKEREQKQKQKQKTGTSTDNSTPPGEVFSPRAVPVTVDYEEERDPENLWKRFRPNVVVSGTAAPWDEDFWSCIAVGTNSNADSDPVRLFGVKSCSRCKQTTVLSQFGRFADDGEPLKTLMRTRKNPGVKDKSIFGINMTMSKHSVGKEIKVGDKVEIRGCGHLLHKWFQHKSLVPQGMFLYMSWLLLWLSVQCIRVEQSTNTRSVWLSRLPYVDGETIIPRNARSTLCSALFMCAMWLVWEVFTSVTRRTIYTYVMLRAILAMTSLSVGWAAVHFMDPSKEWTVVLVMFMFVCIWWMAHVVLDAWIPGNRWGGERFLIAWGAVAMFAWVVGQVFSPVGQNQNLTFGLGYMNQDLFFCACIGTGVTLTFLLRVNSPKTKKKKSPKEERVQKWFWVTRVIGIVCCMYYALKHTRAGFFCVQDPFLWVIGFVLKDFWGGLTAVWAILWGSLGSLLMYIITCHWGVERTRMHLVRKAFHLISFVMLLPMLSWRPRLYRMAMAFVAAVLVLLEQWRMLFPGVGGVQGKMGTRGNEKECKYNPQDGKGKPKDRVKRGLYSPLISTFANDVDKRDQSMVRTHIYLFVGLACGSWLIGDTLLAFCSHPVKAHQPFSETKWIGFVLVAVGDAAAAFWGTLFGTTKWHAETSKTREGTFFGWLSCVVVHFALLGVDSLVTGNAWDWGSLGRAAATYLLALIVEGETDQIDNLCVPLYGVFWSALLSSTPVSLGVLSM